MQLRNALILAGAIALGGIGFTSFAQVIPQPGPPTPIGCAYNTTPVTLTDGQAGWAQCDTAGNQKIVVVPSASTASGIAPVVCGSAVSSCVLKSSAGNLYSVYAECSAACWLQVFNAVSAPSNGATTAGIASGNMTECIPIIAGGAGSISSNGMPPSIYTVGITATISSTTCATLTLATTGFINGKVQ